LLISHSKANFFGLFFGLPRELRDEIYRHLLQHEEPLQYLPVSAQKKGHRAGFYTSADNPKEHNQIKYVNKRLWKETAGLEVKHNALLFCTQLEANTEQQLDLQHDAVAPEVTSQTEGLTLLLNFLQDSHTEWILRLRNIYVRSSEGERYVDNGAYLEVNIDVEDNDISGVFRFCRYYSAMTVFMIVSNFGSQSYAQTFFWGACCLLTTSHKDIPAELRFMAEHMVQQGYHLNLDLHLGDEIPTNWKLNPDGDFDEYTLREQIKRTSTDTEAWLDLAPHENELVPLVKSWYKNGLE
jgi:hypothetical protein